MWVTPRMETDYFDIVAIYLDCVLRTSTDKMKDNGFKLTKERSRRYPAQTITPMILRFWQIDLLKPKHCYIVWNEQLLTLASMSNQDKTECMCFNQRDDISTLNGSSLKLADKFTYQGCSVSSTETDINTRLAKTWTANDIGHMEIRPDR